MHVDLTGTPLSVVLLLCGLTMLSLYFAVCFVLPSLLLLMRIRRANGFLRRMAAPDSDPAIVADTDFDAIFGTDCHLARSWQNYRKTLVSSGGSVGYCATIPASVCFERQENVEVPLKLEFFRYCPGLMTGIGIVGTFTGLLFGLHRFADAITPKVAALSATPQRMGAMGHGVASGASAAVPDGAYVSFISGASAPLPAATGLKILDQGKDAMASAAIAHTPTTLKSMMDPSMLTGALGHLLHSVSDAFVVSAIAVLCALLTTFIEKLLVAQCFHQLHGLSSTIDRLFAFNPCDDPMMRLTRTSEATERQIKQIAVVLDGIAISRGHLS